MVRENYKNEFDKKSNSKMKAINNLENKLGVFSNKKKKTDKFGKPIK